jgi:hypothetical protein
MEMQTSSDSKREPSAMPLPCRNALMETVTYGNRAGAHTADWALSNTTVEVPESTPLKFPLFGQESIRHD